jgi:hypothetical protein
MLPQLDPEKKDHRTAWIAGGAAAAVVAATLHGGIRGYRLRGGKRGHLIAAIEENGQNKLLAKYHTSEEGLQRAANLAKDRATIRENAGRIANELHQDISVNPPIHHGQTAGEITAHIAAHPTIPTSENYEHLTKAREYAKDAAQRHAKVALREPEKANWVYWSEPFSDANPPKPGRFYHPELIQAKNEAWARSEGTRRAKEGIVSTKPVQTNLPARGLRKPGMKDKRGVEHPKSDATDWRVKIDPVTGRQEGKGKPKEMARRFVDRIHEFDIRLKESRNKNGQFSSGNGPMISPRDMQHAYHAPVLREKGMSIGKKLAIGAVGAAGGLGLLIARSPALRARISGKAIVDEAQKATKTAAEKAVETLADRSALLSKHQADLESLKATLSLKHSEDTAKHVAKIGELATALEGMKKTVSTQTETIDSLTSHLHNKAAEASKARTIADTYQQVVGGHNPPPVLKPRDLSNFKRDASPLYTHEEALNKLRQHADYHVDDARLLVRSGENRVEKLKKEEASPYQIAQAQASLHVDTERHAKHLDQRTKINDIAKIEHPGSQAEAIQGLHDEMWKARDESKLKKAEVKSRLSVENAKERMANKKPEMPMGDVIAISQTGVPAVEGRGVGSKRGGKKKNTKNFMSDAQLATHLVAAVRGTEFGMLTEPVVDNELLEGIARYLQKKRLGKPKLLPRARVEPKSVSASTGILPLFGR